MSHSAFTFKSGVVIDEAFAALEEAERLEEQMAYSRDVNRRSATVAAASKYFEACSLLETASASLLLEESKTTDKEECRRVRLLLSDKTIHYKEHAKSVLRCCLEPMKTAVAPSGEVKISLVDAKFSSAMDFDEQGRTEEAIEAYLGAADGYFKALKQMDEETSGSIFTEMTRRLHDILDRVNHLRT